MKYFERRQEFTERQWALSLKYRALRLISSLCAMFGSQFIMLYIMQHIDISAKALQTVAGTATMVASAMFVVLPWVFSRIEKLLVPTLIVASVAGIICDLLVLAYPMIVLMTITIVIGFLDAFMDFGFDKLNNRVFQGDARSLFGAYNRQAGLVGACLASVMCWICANVDLVYIIWADIALSLVDLILIIWRVQLLKAELKWMADNPTTDKATD